MALPPVVRHVPRPLLVAQTGSEPYPTSRRSSSDVKKRAISGWNSCWGQLECLLQECRSLLLLSHAGAGYRPAEGLGRPLLVVPYQQLLRQQLLPWLLQIQSAAAMEPVHLESPYHGPNRQPKVDHLLREGDQSAQSCCR